MTPATIGIIGIVALFALLAIRMPVGIVMMVIGLFGTAEYTKAILKAMGVTGS